MSDSIKAPVHLEFSEKYDQNHAQYYFEKHEQELSRRISNWFEQRAARKALAKAGNPQSVLDLPCGAGRFWELLAREPNRKLYASDYSENMIKTAQTRRAPVIANRFECFQASAFDTKRPDGFVDSVFCMRLMHHVGESKDRLTMLKEFFRITRDTVIISLWVDGNFKARKRQQAEAKRIAQGKPLNNRYLINAGQFEQECQQAGFNVVTHVDALKHFLMWRIYVLRKPSAK